MSRPYFLIISLLSSIACLFDITSVQAEQCLDQPVVLVNDSIITEQDIEQHLRQIQKQQGTLNGENPVGSMPNDQHTPDRQSVLDSLINNELIVQKAQLIAEKISDAELEQIIAKTPKEMLAQLPVHEGIAKFKQALIMQQLTYMAFNQYDARPTETEIEQELENLPADPQELPSLEYHIVDIPILEKDAVETKPASPSAMNAIGILSAKLFWPFTKNMMFNYHPQSIKAYASDVKHTQLPNPSILCRLDIGDRQIQKETLEKFGAKAVSEIDTKDLQWRPISRLPLVYVEAIKRLHPKVGDIIGPFNIFNRIHLIQFLGERGEAVITHARHILITSHDEMDDRAVKRKLNNICTICIKNKNFAAQARLHSEDPESLFKGGDLGWIMPGSTSKIFEEHIKQLAIKEISQPFKTPQGWHIVQVLGRETLTSDHPLFKRYVAQHIISQRKMIKAIESFQEELRSHASIQWLNRPPTEVKKP